jgi:WD40 repeat protein/transcriptional regulator with XRE-family HTH domain
MADNPATAQQMAEQIESQADFGRELTALRERAGLRIRDVGRLSGIPVSTVGDYFSGRHLPADRQQLIRILEVCGETDTARVAWWEAALQRIRRLPGRRTGTPYRGLARFEQQDARWFFGREDVTEHLVSLAAESAALPLVLVGPSGAGKSSLLRAGLLPRLSELAAVAPEIAGPVIVLEPTATPVADLKTRLTELAASLDGAEGGRPAVIVDQFEAVFTRCRDEAQRRNFITELCELTGAALVILALRADFYDQAIRYPGLASALESRQVVLSPMTADQVRRAVIEPARLAKVAVEDGLVGLLLADLAPRGASVGAANGAEPGGPDAPGGPGGPGGAYERGVLPLLSHAMLATWERSRGGTLAIADYLASGGIKDALTQTAERAYGSLTPDQQRLARRLFLHLVHVADDLPPSRATVELGELRDWGSDAEAVLATFVDERMITVDAGTAQLTHDALLTAWPRLRSWIEGGRDGLRTRRRITEGARAWADTGRERAALWRGSQLAVARDWAADEDNRASLPALAAGFVAASIAEDSAVRRAQRRRTRRLQGVIAILTALVLAVAVLTVYAFRQRQAAGGARDAAIAASQSANSREAAIEAGQLRAQDPSLAAQLSVAAYGVAHTPQATAALLESSGEPSAARIVDSPGVVQSVSVSPDRRLLAAAGADGTLRLWNVAVPGHPSPVATLVQANGQDPLYTAAFSPDGKTLAAAGAGRVVRLWDVADPVHPVPVGQPLTGPSNTIYSVAFSPDGKTLAAASADKTVRLWNVADPAQAVPLGQPLTGPAGYVESVAFSPDGKTLAAASADKTVWLWDVANPAEPFPYYGMPLTGPAALVTAVAFSPDGHTLAAASQDDKVWLWTLAASMPTASQDGTLTGATDWVNTIAFSPDGTSIAAGTSDAGVLIWSRASRNRIAMLPRPQPVTSIAWDGPGRLASGDADGTVSMWTLPSPELAAADKTTMVAYSPNGATLAVGGQDVQLWNAASRTHVATHPLAAGMVVNGLAFSPDGRILAAAYSDHTVGLLNASTLAPLGAPFQVTAAGNAETVAFSPDGTVLATGGDDGTVRLWSITDPAHPSQLSSVHDSGTYVFTVVFSPDGKTLAAASTDNLTRLWDVANPARPAQLGKPLGGFSSYAIGLAFTPDGKLLAVGSADKTIRLWSIANPARPVQVGAPLTGPAGYVWGLAFSPDGTTLAAGVTDGTVWLWRVTAPASPSLIATLTGPAGHVYSVAFAPSGGQLAASSDDGTVHLWNVSPGAAESQVCANLGQPLTRAEWNVYVPGVPYRAPCS